MKILNRKILLGLLLITLSGLFYLIHYVIFKDAHHIFIYMIGDIAFVFVEVLMVTLIIHEMMNEREKRNRMEKLNMVIGAFFSECGTRLLTYFSNFDPKLDKIRDNLVVTDNWSKDDFRKVNRSLKNYGHEVDIHKIDLENLHNFLSGEKHFFLRLLENPSLLEHESFTELLRAVFHLAEELALAYRKDLLNLPAVNYSHLAGDIKRAYSQLIYQWLDYMQYLKNNYPYLFSLAMRTNPFDQNGTGLDNHLSEEE
ncbi:MAG: hypothetical protein JXA35_03495 [Deltaproteobacteria bacterium]|nr:hypothetical protein [Deltaproteobacteria bacterium]